MEIATLTNQLAESKLKVTALEGDKTKLEGEKTTLTNQLAEVNNKVAALEGKTEVLATANTNIASEITVLERENQTLGNQVLELSKDRDAWKLQAETVHKQLAVKLAEHGIRATAVEVPKTGASGGKLTATERVKLARGE